MEVGLQIFFSFLVCAFPRSQIFYNERFNALVIFPFKLVTLLNKCHKQMLKKHLFSLGRKKRFLLNLLLSFADISC